MTVIQITCDNCGAKYKLPETFTGTQAKCQKCGSVIDVSKQRHQPAAAGAPASHAASAAKPAAPRPAAAAKPAVDRSKVTEKPERTGRIARAAINRPDADEEGEKGHHGKHKHVKKKDNKPLIFGGIGLLAIVVVVVVLMMKGDDPPKTDATAKVDPAAAKPADKPVDKPVDAQPAKPADQPAEKPADKPADPKPADASGTLTTPADAEAAKKLKPWEKLKITTIDQVTDPKTYKEVVWPATIDEAKKAEIRALCNEVPNGGVSGIRAKDKLAKIDYDALFGIVEKLRTLDYKSPEESMVAFEFNKLLEQMTGDLQAGFLPVEADENIDPRKVEWNTRTVKTWLQLFDKDEATFKKDRAERKKKAAEKDK